jgi:hypothetical protein
MHKIKYKLSMGSIDVYFSYMIVIKVKYSVNGFYNKIVLHHGIYRCKDKFVNDFTVKEITLCNEDRKFVLFIDVDGEWVKAGDL